LTAGTVLVDEHIMYARPAIKIPASELPDILGKRLLRDLLRGELISRQDLL
jgi:sialic acid synthase SpsE